MLRIYAHQYGSSWKDILHMVNPPLNTRYLSKTKLTPEELLFGRINQTDELVRCNDLPQDVKSERYKQALQRKCAELHEIYKAQRKRDAEKNLERVNKGRKVSNIKCNDVVFMLDRPTNPCLILSSSIFLGGNCFPVSITILFANTGFDKQGL